MAEPQGENIQLKLITSSAYGLQSVFVQQFKPFPLKWKHLFPKWDPPFDEEIHISPVAMQKCSV